MLHCAYSVRPVPALCPVVRAHKVVAGRGLDFHLMINNEDLFSSPLPHPTGRGGLSKEDELLWFQRRDCAQQQLQGELSNEERQVWQGRLDHVRNYITTSNLALALKVAARFAMRSNANRSISDELQSAANEALVRAVDAFRLERKVRFSSYGWLVIENKLFKIAAKETTARRRVVAATDYESTVSEDEQTSAEMADPQTAAETTTQNVELVNWVLSNTDLSDEERAILDMRYRQNLKLREI